MQLILQLTLFCLLFLAMVKALVRSSGKNCLYFYPQPYLAEAQKRGLADPAALLRRGKRIMVPFCLILLAALVCILAFWTRVTTFRQAFLLSYLFLVVMNWFDGILLDRLWVAHSPVWRIPGMEGVPYIKPWTTVLKKRALATLLYLPLSLLPAALALLLSPL